MTAASCLTVNFVDNPSITSDSYSNIQLPLIALDVGMKRIGVAVSDRLGFSCRGITCLHRLERGWPGQLVKLIQEYGSRGIVVGLPKNMDGTEGVQAADVRMAVADLEKVTELGIVYQDERLSTWTAKERLFAQGLNEKKVRLKLDQTAAAVILEDFLATHPEIGRPKNA